MTDDNDRVIEPEWLWNRTTRRSMPRAHGRAGGCGRCPSSQLPLIPLRPRPCFPALLVPLAANGPQQMAAVRQAAESPSRAIGLVMVRDVEGRMARTTCMLSRGRQDPQGPAYR